MDWIVYIASAIISGVVSGAVAYGSLRTDLKYLRRDLDEVRERLWGARA